MTGKEASSSKRNLTVDTLKGVAILLVVFGHCLNNVIESPLVETPPAWIPAAKNFIYFFHMPLFFFLSGIFSYKTASHGLKTALIDKIKRLLVPYVVFSVLTTVVKVIFSDYQNNPRELSVLLRAWYEPIGIYWFLYALFFISILYCIVVAIVKDETRSNVIFLSIGIALYILGYHLEKLPIFWISYTIYQFQIWFALGLFGKQILSSFEKHSDQNREPRYPAVLYKPGQKTMDIYCLHQFVAGGFRIIFLKLLGTSFLSARVIFITIATMIICYLISVSKIAETKVYKVCLGYKI
ncbi:MAG: acyltransferase family protein [Lachnospiraceae bacterium]|nr:acyltransferase family protein [Lachnospiraceae bacterium]